MEYHCVPLLYTSVYRGQTAAVSGRTATAHGHYSPDTYRIRPPTSPLFPSTRFKTSLGALLARLGPRRVGRFECGFRIRFSRPTARPRVLRGQKTLVRDKRFIYRKETTSFSSPAADKRSAALREIRVSRTWKHR